MVIRGQQKNKRYFSKSTTTTHALLVKGFVVIRAIKLEASMIQRTRSREQIQYRGSGTEMNRICDMPDAVKHEHIYVQPKQTTQRETQGHARTRVRERRKEM